MFDVEEIVGKTFNHDFYGTYCVLSFHKEIKGNNKYKIKFNRTGYITFVTYNDILNNDVVDKIYLHNKRMGYNWYSIHGVTFTHPTYGDYTVISVSDKKYKIKFKKTGYITTDTLRHIKSLNVIDVKQLDVKAEDNFNDIIEELGNTVFYHKKYGEYSILSKEHNGSYKIRFKNTGYETIVALNKIRKGVVIDKHYRPLYKNEGFIHHIYGMYYVIDKVEASSYKIRFKNTGYECVNTLGEIINFEVKDELYHKEANQ